MKTQWLSVSLRLAIASLVALALWHYTKTEAPPPVTVDLTCPNPVAGCTAQIGTRAVSVGLAGSVKPLTPFQAWVKAPGADEVRAGFAMVGMNMGFNFYSLRPDSAGVFRAQITLPACVSGRRDWVMTVEIDNVIRIAMPFATEL